MCVCARARALCVCARALCVCACVCVISPASKVPSGAQQAASNPPPRYILATIFSCCAAREHDTQTEFDLSAAGGPAAEDGGADASTPCAMLVECIDGPQSQSREPYAACDQIRGQEQPKEGCRTDLAAERPTCVAASAASALCIYPLWEGCNFLLQQLLNKNEASGAHPKREAARGLCAT